MAIKIPVSAQFDAADVKQQIQIINDQIKILSNTVAMASNKKFEPVTLKSKEDLNAFMQQAQKLLKIQTELQNKLGGSGQAGKNPFLADWSKMYGDKGTRIEKMMNALQFMGVEFDDKPAPKPKPPAPTNPNPNQPPAPPRSPGQGGGAGWGQQGLNVLNSGMNAFGPVGGVFSNALRSGMSGGAGAGLMGLVGGLAALGVGKIIGAVAEKIDKAQDAAIGMDKIYRQIGGIASYSSIKKTVYDVGSRLGMDVNESIGLGSTYAKAANLRAGDNLATGMLVSGGMGRTFGMDPNSTAQIMGGFRGANIAQNDKDLKRIGLVIGETIGRSNAFARADEMMQAVSQYALAQARQSLTAPNIGAYGGAMSSLMSANIPGLDVGGSAQLLSRVNASLSSGGAMGEASQMMTARVGMENGLNPMQLRMLREGGMFATKSQIFGKDSMYGKTLGAGPGGDQSFYSMTRDQMRRSYGGQGQDYYLALANHLGVSVGQAMAMDKMDTTQLSGIANSGVDLSKVNATGIGTIGQIQSGRGLGGLAQGYLNAKGKNALSDEERKNLLSAYNGNDPEKLKDVLTQVAAKRGAVETEGSQIRDGIAQLNNTMTKFADNALPALNVMRMAMVKLTGGSESALRKSYETTESQDRIAQLGEKYKPRFDRIKARRAELQRQGKGLQDAGAYKELTDLKSEEQYWSSRQALEIENARKEAHEMAYGAASPEEASGQTGTYGASPAADAAEAGAAPSSGGSTGGGGSSGAYTSAGSGNVGNVRDAKTGQFRRFKSAREGMATMAGQLLRYQSKKKWGNKKTLRQIISTYAPSSENDTATYIAQVAKWTGINPDSEIDLRDRDTMEKVMRAMIRKESKNGSAAAEGHYDEAIGDAMRTPSNFSDSYPSEIRLAVDVNGPWGTKTAEHTHRQFKQQGSWGTR
ncbi:lytic transglycosylase [Salmonella enterica]|nr:lytic transglycosylase [Salmonella enterica]EAO0118540.1 lytic transglycosylase [Salmonella enterica]EAO3601645.1 lytic transglycosylase [Salmonella enterica]EAR6391538.1 lytic transglycosylase [Salmonella enterica]EAV1285302.1 lytic transglycosylase [Salmonella enterica]